MSYQQWMICVAIILDPILELYNAEWSTLKAGTPTYPQWASSVAAGKHRVEVGVRLSASNLNEGQRWFSISHICWFFQQHPKRWLMVVEVPTRPALPMFDHIAGCWTNSCRIVSLAVHCILKSQMLNKRRPKAKAHIIYIYRLYLYILCLIYSFIFKWA